MDHNPEIFKKSLNRYIFRIVLAVLMLIGGGMSFALPPAGAAIIQGYISDEAGNPVTEPDFVANATAES